MLLHTGPEGLHPIISISTPTSGTGGASGGVRSFLQMEAKSGTVSDGIKGQPFLVGTFFSQEMETQAISI